MSIQKKISEEFKQEIKERFNEVSSWKVMSSVRETSSRQQSIELP